MVNGQNYSYEDIKIVVNGNEVYNKGYDLIEFKVFSEVNHHTRLSLKTKVKKEYANEWDVFSKTSRANAVPGERELSFFLGERKYFSGIIQEGTSFIRDDGDLVMELIVYSKSEMMDRDINFRVYQNPKIKYIDIVKSIINKYEYITAIGINKETYSEDSGIDERLSLIMKSSLIIQYKETDWEFLIRIMSHIGIGVFNTENGHISVNKQWNVVTGNIGRGIDKYDNIYHKLETQDFFLLGDNIIQQDKRDMGYVNKCEIECIDGKFYGKYFLRQSDYWFDYIPNSKIMGAKIDCKVVSIPLIDNKEGIAILAVSFFDGIDKLIKNKEKNRSRTGNTPTKIKNYGDWVSYKGSDGYFYFPYSTFYSKTNTGYFCTPEVSDIVPVVFESDEECEGFVGFSIDNPMSGRFSNPYYRNYTTHPEGGSEDYCYEFSVSRDNLSVKCKNTFSETVENKIIDAKNSININSDNTIGIENKNTMTMKTKTYDVNVVSEYVENVTGEKNCSLGSLKEQVSTAKEINCQVYDLTAGVYKTNK